MRIDLPLCDMDDCKWCAGGNCTATEVRRIRCPYLHYTDLAEQGRLVEVIHCDKCKHLDLIKGKSVYAECVKTKTLFRPFGIDTREHYCSFAEARLEELEE